MTPTPTEQRPQECKWSKSEDWAGLLICYTCPKASSHHCMTAECAKCLDFTPKEKKQ